MLIRSAVQNDRKSWDALWEGYQDYYEVDLSGTADNTWQRLMAEQSVGPFCLVCEDDVGDLVGFVTYLFHDHTGTPNPDVIWSTFTRRPKSVARASAGP